MSVVVVFRKWTGENKGILALFPTLPADNNGHFCDSYEHIGQHGGADYYGCIAASVPAKPGEYADLYKELTRIGYHLVVCKRASYKMHKERSRIQKTIVTH